MDLVEIPDSFTISELMERWKDKKINGHKLDEDAIYHIGENGTLEMFFPIDWNFEKGRRVEFGEIVIRGFNYYGLYDDTGKRIEYLISKSSVYKLNRKI